MLSDLDFGVCKTKKYVYVLKNQTNPHLLMMQFSVLVLQDKGRLV